MVPSMRRDALPQKLDHRCRHLAKVLYLVRSDYSRLDVIGAQRANRVACYYQTRGRVEANEWSADDERMLHQALVEQRVVHHD